MANIKDAEITIEINAELLRTCRENMEIVKGFHKLLGVHSSTEALAKIAVLMREDDTADRLLSKALGHLHSCSEPGSSNLYQEIAAAFGEAVEHSVQRTGLCPECGAPGYDKIVCEQCGFPHQPRR